MLWKPPRLGSIDLRLAVFPLPSREQRQWSHAAVVARPPAASPPAQSARSQRPGAGEVSRCRAPPQRTWNINAAIPHSSRYVVSNIEARTAAPKRVASVTLSSLTFVVPAGRWWKLQLDN